MREILFRGKGLNGEGWVYGTPAAQNDAVIGNIHDNPELLDTKPES